PIRFGKPASHPGGVHSEYKDNEIPPPTSFRPKYVLKVEIQTRMEYAVPDNSGQIERSATCMLRGS
ncbi:hypothetical protein, partial [Alistipes sp.]|uniref:hypothetical protein n=1 Tax=Alistipes sp. TaxID=1872444 RepID=UPI003AF19A61